MERLQRTMKFSVVTPSYNQGEYIDQTIKSVVAQEYADFEHFVIDGGSDDHTVRILKKYPHLVWVSEKDRGQSDAVNKGFKLATGDIIAWINSDDWYEPGTFTAVAEFFAANPDKNIVMGNCNLVDSRGKVTGQVKNFERGFDALKKYWVGESIPTQPAIFFRRELLEKQGFLDESLHLAMDFDLWMRFSLQNRFYHLDRTVANYRFHDAAKGGDRDWDKFVPEWKTVYKRYAGPVIENPRVSVVMPVYNGESYLAEAIDSILSQTMTDFELLVVNDGSTDGSKAIVKSYDDPRIRLIETEANSGVVAARNLGLAHAGGEYIALLDCDDFAYPSRLAEQAAFMDEHPEFGMIGSWVEIMDEKGRSTGDVWRLDAAAEETSSILLFHNYIAQSAAFIRKKSLPDDLYQPDFAGTEDFELWVRMARAWQVWNLPRVLVKYRVHSASISFVHAERIEQSVQEIIRRQLRLLGMEPTTQEMQLHRDLGRTTFCGSRDFVDDAASWLSRLLAANDQKRCFPSDALNEVVAAIWLAVCFSATGLGLWTLRRYLDSPLRRSIRLDKQHLLLAVKCAIGPGGKG